jgi:hypothetical protein
MKRLEELRNTVTAEEIETAKTALAAKPKKIPVVKAAQEAAAPAAAN